MHAFPVLDLMIVVLVHHARRQTCVLDGGDEDEER